MQEVEAKLIVNDDPNAAKRIREVLCSAGLKVGPATIRKSTDTYFDTPDWDLFHYGWTCRLRKGEQLNLLAMKKRGHLNGGIARREELEQTIEGPPTSTQDFPEGPMRTVCDQATGGRPLKPVFCVKKVRQSFDVSSANGMKAKAAFDQVSQVVPARKNGTAGLAYKEFELELTGGSDEELNRICELLEKELSLTPARLNKFERGYRRVKKKTSAGGQLSLRPDASVQELAHAYLSQCFQDLQREEPRAWEGIDTEGVHQMRVAIRRIRTTLKTLSEFFAEDIVSKLKVDLAWLAMVLGAVRDLDVYQQSLRTYANSLAGSDTTALEPYHEYLSREWLRARRSLLKALSSRRYADFKKRFERFLRQNSALDSEKNPSARLAAEKFIVKAARRLRRDGELITTASQDSELHQLRIRGKRLRYVLELFVPVLGSRMEPTMRCVKKLQDCLGNHHDAHVADEKLRAFAERVALRSGNRGLFLALGELIHVQQIAARDERNAFFKLWPQISKEIRQAHLRRKRLGA
jgi:inorganic triphosphatase YgiF